MRSLFSRLFGSGQRARRGAVTCYLRENGPIAYQLDLFDGEPRERAEALMDSGLSWAWKSRTREWTHLTRISLSAFLADLPAGALIAGAEGDLPTHITDDVVKDWIRHFCRVDPVPLAVAITVTPDRQLVFVQQHPSSTVSALLDALHLDRKAATRSAYPRLGAASLESVAERL